MNPFFSIFAGAVLIVGCFFAGGCAQMNAAYDIGYQRKYFENRILLSGTVDYTRFLNLSKEAYPALAGYCHEHGNPSVIVPTYSPIAQFVWEKEKTTLSITYMDNLEVQNDIPPKVLEYRAKEKLSLNNK